MSVYQEDATSKPVLHVVYRLKVGAQEPMILATRIRGYAPETPEDLNNLKITLGNWLSTWAAFDPGQDSLVIFSWSQLYEHDVPRAPFRYTVT